MNDFESAKQAFLEGMQRLQADDFAAAESQFTRSLALLPNRVSTLNNLAVVQLKLKKFATAEATARQAIGCEAHSPEAWTNLALTLTATERFAEALPAYDQVLQLQPTNAGAWLSKARILLELKRYAEALTACEQGQPSPGSSYEWLYLKSQILKGLERLDEAQIIYRKALTARAAAAPVFVTELRASQKAELLIINQNPGSNETFKPFEFLHLNCGNYPGQLYRRFQDQFHFTYIFEEAAIATANRARIPQPDFVLNNCANGELLLTEGNLAPLSDLMDSFGVPVINHPALAVQTTRDESVRLVDGTPGVVVPQTRRFSMSGQATATVVEEIEAHFDYPLITRTLASQMGKGMTKVDSPAELLAVLQAPDFPEDFFVTQFVDSRGENKFYRKIRAAIVQDSLVIMRVDCDTIWKIYARKSDERVAFYTQNAYLLEEEKRLCSDPETWLGRPAMQALHALRRRIPMDVFGIDFDVDVAGRVVFYEANATMNLFSTARKEVPNPQVAEEALKRAFEDYFHSLAALGSKR